MIIIVIIIITICFVLQYPKFIWDRFCLLHYIVRFYCNIPMQSVAENHSASKNWFSTT